jgi:hypothetical protein
MLLSYLLSYPILVVLGIVVVIISSIIYYHIRRSYIFTELERIVLDDLDEYYYIHSRGGWYMKIGKKNSKLNDFIPKHEWLRIKTIHELNIKEKEYNGIGFFNYIKKVYRDFIKN